MGDDRISDLDAERASPRPGRWAWCRRAVMVAVAALAGLMLVAVSPSPAAHAATFEVNSDGDGDDFVIDGSCNVGPVLPAECTLRAAIEEAVALGGSNSITFNIPSNAPNTRPSDQVRVIKVGGCGCDLPLIDSSVNGLAELTIDGSTQGARAGNGAPLVLIVPDPLGGAPKDNGLITSDVRLTVINLAIGGGFDDGIEIAGSTGSVVRGSFFGIDPDGVTAIPNNYGLYLNQADGVDIGGSTAADRNVFSGNTFDGIDVDHGSLLMANESVIHGSYIGMNAAGAAVVPNGEDGIYLGGALTVTIGGTNPGEGNVIAGNTVVGIYVDLAAETTILGNLIGIGPDGTTPRPNGTGIWVDSADDTDVGGRLPGSRNVISGNTNDGIYLTGTCACVGNSNIRGNYIGLNAAGATAVPNHGNGIHLFEASGIIIGGDRLNEGNVVSGNTLSGVLLEDVSSAQILIFGNRIGTDATGTIARGNGLDGITGLPEDPNDPFGVGPLDPVIGEELPGFGNLISGNGRHGIYLLHAVGLQGIEIGRNSIGVKVDGSGSLPNGGDGILLVDSAPADVFENIVANNGRGGIVMSFDLASPENLMTGNSIYNNGGPGIDLTDAVDANGVGDGTSDNVPGSPYNFPVLTAATTSPGGTVIAGTLDSVPDLAFRVELFSNPSCDPSGNGEGRGFLGAVDVQTDAMGQAAFAATTAQIPPGQFITATSTNVVLQTSEFSACLPVTSAAVQVTPTSGLVTTEAGGTATFTVALSTLPVADVTIGLSSSRPAEATVSPSSLTFTSADGTTPKTVTVTGVPDTVADGNQTFTIVTAPATSLDPAYAGIDPPDVAGLNQDSTTLPTLAIHPSTVSEGTGTNTPMAFSVTLAPASTQQVTVNWQVIDGTAQVASDIAPGESAGMLTFAPGETSKSIVLHVVGDNVPEQNETFTVRLSGANTVIGVDSAFGTINNDDGTPGPCAPRPKVTLTTQRTGTDQLVVTVTAGSGTIQTIAFGSAAKPIQNATIETINPSGIIQSYGTFTAPAGVTQQAFIVRRIAPSQPVMVTLVIKDGCGDWTTFIGTGPAGF
jgi:hypothetical protein